MPGANIECDWPVRKPSTLIGQLLRLIRYGPGLTNPRYQKVVAAVCYSGHLRNADLIGSKLRLSMEIGSD